MLLALTIAYRIRCVVLNDILDERIFIEMDLVVEHAHFLKDDFIVFLHWLVLFHDCCAWTRCKDHWSFFDTSGQTIMPASTCLSSCTFFRRSFQLLYQLDRLCVVYLFRALNCNRTKLNCGLIKYWSIPSVIRTQKVLCTILFIAKSIIWLNYGLASLAHTDNTCAIIVFFIFFWWRADCVL